MSISSALCTSFKVEVLKALHNFNTGGDTFKMALYNISASLDQTTTAYSSSNEIVSSGYSAGGMAVVPAVPTSGGTTAYVDFTDTVFTSTTMTGIYGALIYNSTQANRAVLVLSFGSAQASTAAGFTVIYPPANSTDAVLLIE